HTFSARADAPPPGVTLRRVPVVRAGRLVRLLSFAAIAPRLVARERWDVVVGFGRTPRQDVVRVGGGTHRSYLARMEAAGLRGRWRGPYHRAILRLEARAFAPGAYRRVLAVSDRVRDEVAADYHVPPERIRGLYHGVVLEACAAGVPVVTTRRAGAAELLDGPLAALVVEDPEDLDALARALAHALGPAHDALAQAARARAEQFPWDKHLDGLEALLTE